MAGGVFVFLLAGCAGPSALGSPAGVGQTGAAGDGFEAVELEADWDDLDAAVDVMLSACELAVLERDSERVRIERSDVYFDEPYPDEVVVARSWRLVTRDGRTGRLIASRSVEAASAGDGATAIGLRVRIGLLGTPSEQRCVLDAVERRLGQLRGSVAAPL